MFGFYLLFFYLYLFFSGFAYADEFFIRAFDLGGGGLKTARLLYDTDSEKMNWIEPQTQLGKCPDALEVKDWIRIALKEKTQQNLDEEIAAGYFFGFSLAGLDKLRSYPLVSSDMSVLCDLPKDKVAAIGDGTAHLVASLHFLKNKLPEGSVWNFAIGTGVGVAYAGSDHKVAPIFTVYKAFGSLPWNIQESGGEYLGRACNSGVFDRALQKNDLEQSFLQFAEAWKPYLDVVLSNQNLPKVGSIVFTGGHIDTYKDKLVEVLSYLELPVVLFSGPPCAGLFGAALNVMNSFSQGIPRDFSSLNEEELLTYFEEGKEIRDRDALGLSALAFAVQKKLPQVAKALIQKGAWVNLPDFAGERPLALAVKQGDLEMVQLLLDSGANILFKDYYGRDALFFAKKSGEEKTLDLLEKFN